MFETSRKTTSRPQDRHSARQDLGGSSSINGMLYVRASRWTTTPGPSSAIAAGPTIPSCLLQEIRALRTRRQRPSARTGGVLNVADMRERHEMVEAFIDGGVELGYSRNKDYNNATRKASATSR